MASRQEGGEAAALLRDAVVAGRIGAVESLLVDGADPNFDAKGLTDPLGLAIQANRLDIVRLLLNHGANMRSGRGDGYAAIHQACFAGHLPIVEELLTAGANVNERDPKGGTPLHLMAAAYEPVLSDRLEVLKMLIRAGVQLDVRDAKGYAAIHHAACLGNLESLKELVAAGSSHAWRTTYSQTPLILACLGGHWMSVIFLLNKCKADPGVVDARGSTPLSVAAKYGHVDVLKVLLRFNVHQLGPKAYPDALAFAVAHPKVRMLSMLLSADGCPYVNCIEPTTGWSPLHVAVVMSRSIATHILLSAGADENAVDPRGYSLLELAENMAFKGIVQRRIRRMLVQAPAYRARSWRWPDESPVLALSLTTAPATSVVQLTKGEARAATSKGQVEPVQMPPENLDDAYNVPMTVTTAKAVMQTVGVRVFRRPTNASCASAIDGHPMVVAGLIRYARKT